MRCIFSNSSYSGKSDGSDYVGSMVVMEDGLLKKSDYRRYKVSAVQGNDDFGAMHEVLTRRLKRFLLDLEEKSNASSPKTTTDKAAAAFTTTFTDSLDVRDVVAEKLQAKTSESHLPHYQTDGNDLEQAKSERDLSSDSSFPKIPKRFSYQPNLILIDGGKGQLSVGVRVLEELGLEGKVELAALAKRYEEVYRPGSSDPMEIPRNSEAIFLLRQIRDEAHRFAIGFHRQLRAKRMTRSVLDDIDGLGEKRRQKLLRHFGSITKLKEASYEDLELCSWLPKSTRDAIWEKLHHMPKGSL